MAGLINQQNKLMSVSTSLGDDVVALKSMRVTEALGRPFEIVLELLSSDVDIGFEKILGENATVRVESEKDGEEARYFNGWVSEFAQTGTLGRFVTYRATLVPWFWFLTRASDCRIFQEKTVPEIVEEIFADVGFNDYRLESINNCRTWEYCVQYRETDFNFVSRLLELEGIYYYFEHENGKHTMVLCTPDSAKGPYPGFNDIPYYPPTQNGVGEGCIHGFQIVKQVQPTTFALKDYNFTTPEQDLASKSSITRQHSQGDHEIYDYPGDYETKAEGDNYAKVRVEELQSEFERVTGEASTRGIACGYTFNLTGDFPRSDQAREYLVVSTSINASVNAGESGVDDGDMGFACTFEAVDQQQPFRPRRITPKPLVQGPQTAVVVGPAGEEIHTDAHGRIKVQFHWDRLGKADDKSSCWVRVAQSVAGAGWGEIMIPRIGQEVIVNFLEGDPDKPIVVGSVYNEKNKPPFALPDEKNVYGYKSNSTKGGDGFNELTFNDTKGKENYVMHAEKDMHLRVKNIRHETVLNERHLIVGVDGEDGVGDKFEQVMNDSHLEIKNNRNEKVGNNYSLTVEKNVSEKFDGDHSEITKGDVFIKGANIVLEAGTNITLKVGGSTIAIDASSITIKTVTLEEKATTVKVEGQAKIEQKAPMVKIEGSATVEVKGGGMGTFDGGGMAIIKGGLVKIN